MSATAFPSDADSSPPTVVELALWQGDLVAEASTERVPRSLGWDWGVVAALVTAVGLHALLLGSFLLRHAVDYDDDSRDQIGMMKGYLGASSGGVENGVESSSTPPDTSTSAVTRSGLALTAMSAGHAVMPGPVSREQALGEAQSFGIIGLLSAEGGPAGGQPWAQAPSGDGSMWVTGPDDGISGALLSGTGEGCGPCLGEGISLGGIGTIGHGIGPVPRGYGAGGTASGRMRGHHLSGIVDRCDDTCIATTGERLPPEAIRRVVRQSFGRFRFCYERGLAHDPSLAGRVSTKFVIDRDGSVAMVADAGSDLRDDAVVACVGRAFGSLSFPEPAGGVVNVTYPLVFSPDT